MIDQKDLSDNDMELVLDAALKKDESTKLEIYKLFKEVSIKLRVEDIEKIIDFFSEKVPPERFVE